MTDVLTVWRSAGVVVAVVLQGFDTRCISIHHTHVTLISLYLCFLFGTFTKKVFLLLSFQRDFGGKKEAVI